SKDAQLLECQKRHDRPYKGYDHFLIKRIRKNGEKLDINEFFHIDKELGAAAERLRAEADVLEYTEQSKSVYLKAIDFYIKLKAYRISKGWMPYQEIYYYND